MASLDPSLAEPTPTGVVAERVDIFRIAVSEMRRAGFDPEPDEVLRLAHYLDYGTE